jgi:hypothetical protein
MIAVSFLPLHPHLLSKLKVLHVKPKEINMSLAHHLDVIYLHQFLSRGFLDYHAMQLRIMRYNINGVLILLLHLHQALVTIWLLLLLFLLLLFLNHLAICNLLLFLLLLFLNHLAICHLLLCLNLLVIMPLLHILLYIKCPCMVVSIMKVQLSHKTYRMSIPSTMHLVLMAYKLIILQIL